MALANQNVFPLSYRLSRLTHRTGKKFMEQVSGECSLILLFPLFRMATWDVLQLQICKIDSMGNLHNQ